MTEVTIKRRTKRLVPRSPDVDGFIPSAVVPVLYERWKSAWEAPIVLSGGTTSITCDMVLDVGFKALSRTYGVRRAKLFIESAQRGAL